MSVTTINTEMGHFDFQKNGVTITLTGAGTVASPWVCNISGIPTGSGTDNHIVRWDGTTNFQDSGVTIDDFNNITGGKDIIATGEVSFGSSGGDIVTFGRVGTGTIYYRWPAATANAVLTTPAAGSPWDLVWTPLSSFLLSGGAAGGDLSGTYPNPSIANDAVTLAKMAHATEGQIIDFSGGTGAPAATDSPKIGGDTRIYLDVRAQGEYLFYDSDSTGLGVTSWTEATPATTNGGQAELQLDGIVANAGNAEVWFRLGALPADWQGRNWRFTGLGYKIQKVAGDNTEVYAGLYAEVMDSGAATADWTVVDALLGPVATGAAPLWEEGVLTPTPAAVGNGPLWLRIQITADAADVGNLVRIRVYPGAFYISGDTL